MSRTQITVFVLVAIVALVLGLTVNKVLNSKGQADPTVLLDAGIVLLPQSRSLPELTMTNQDGQPQAVDQLKGKWSLLFFGYTFCPDICPTTLAELRQLSLNLPDEQRQQLRVTMISVDPKRDTPQQMSSYLNFFDAGFAGASGDPEELARLAQALSVAYIEPDTSQDNYLVDHSGQVVIVDPAGQYVGFIRPPLRPQQLGELLPRVMARAR